MREQALAHLIEIARLFPTSVVYAIEKLLLALPLIEQNCRRFQGGNVISIHGSAPRFCITSCLNRIFIGGSNLSQIP